MIGSTARRGPSGVRSEVTGSTLPATLGDELWTDAPFERPAEFWPRPPSSPADVARAAAHAELVAAVSEAVAAANPPPCTVLVTARWTTDDPAEGRYLARACAGCPVFAVCSAYIEAHPEESGVWAGTTPAERRAVAAGRAAS